MALPNYLENIKSSGIYRFVFDKSATPAGVVTPKRLIIGYSERGPFNTPVFVDSVSEFKKLFGDTNKKLERYGDFFHRSCLQALATEPIYALNIKNFNGEKVEGLSFDATGINDKGEYPVTDIYDKSRFWYLEPKNLKKDGGKNLYIAATDSSNCSNTIFIKGFIPKGYNITFKEWFSTVMNGQELPAYLEGHESEKLQDYFVKIYVFAGDINKDLAATDFYKKYFKVENDVVYAETTVKNAFGEDCDALDLFAANSKSNLVGAYSGIMLPDFVTSNNQALSVVDIFNSDNSKHKMMMFQDTDMLYDDESTFENLKVPGNGLYDTENGPKAFYLKGYTYELDRPSNTSSEEAKLEWQNNILDALKGIEETHNIQDENITTEVKLGGTYYEYGKESKVDFSPVMGVLATLLEEFGGQLYVKKEEGGYRELNVGSTEAAGDVLFIKTSEGWKLVPLYKSQSEESRLTEEEEQDVYTAVGSALGMSDWRTKYVLSNEPKEMVTEVIGYKGLRVALTDRTSIDYRYLIDTFETYITKQAKSIFSNICKEKENALAILNFPSANVIKSHTYRDGLQGDVVNTFMNKDMIDFSVMTDPGCEFFSLADEDNGASFAAYYTPVNLVNPITNVKYTVPSAALVSNAFIDKYISRLPYSIVAGPNYGKIITANLVGPDYNYSREDRDELEPYGVNCLLYVPRKGTYINSNQTAKQNPVTALSKVHIRELVIFLQDEIEKLLQNYQWEFNTQTLRDTIKGKADVILQTCQFNSGIYDFTTQCDAKNNTQEVIDNEMLILDYAIEPARGAGKMVQQLTIYKTGGLSSTTIA